MENRESQVSEKSFKSRFSVSFKIVALSVLATFLLRDVAWAADSIYQPKNKSNAFGEGQDHLVHREYVNALFNLLDSLSRMKYDKG